MWYLADEMSDVFHEPPSPHRINFYFVDVPSWFDLSLTDLRKDDPRRLDQVLTKPNTFYGYLLEVTGYANEVYEDTEEEYARTWPHEKVLERIFNQVHCISREQMRKRVGKETFDLTFAPKDIGAPSSSNQAASNGSTPVSYGSSS